MSIRIVRAVTYDVRFPTSLSGAGSDAMNPDPDYSAAYVTLETDDPSILTPLMEAEQQRCRISIQCANIVISGLVGSFEVREGRREVRMVVDEPSGLPPVRNAPY